MNKINETSFCGIILKDSRIFVGFFSAKLDNWLTTLRASTSSLSFPFHPLKTSIIRICQIFVGPTLPSPTIDLKVSGKNKTKNTANSPPNIDKNQKILLHPKF